MKNFPVYVGEAVLLFGICRALQVGIGGGRHVENGDADFAVDVFEAPKVRAQLDIAGRLEPNT